jgi:SNF2 family DNA or RNA helicase
VTNVDQSGTLLPHQLAFYEHFLAPDTSRRQVLIAPPGMGKGFVAQLIAHHVAKDDPSARILILAPAALVDSFSSALNELEPTYRVDVVDRKRLREVVSAAQTYDLWQSPAVIVMSIEFAKKEDVLTLLAGTHWSLVIMDEAHALQGRRKQLVEQLSGSAERLLLLGGVEDASRAVDAISGLEVVRWTRDATDAQGRALFVEVPRAHHVIDYMRSDDEAAFATHLLQAFDQVMVDTNSPQVELAKRIATSALASSPAAIERALLGHGERLASRLGLDRSWGNSDYPPGAADGLDFDLGLSTPSIWRDPDRASSVLAELVGALELLPVDSKAAKLREFVAVERGRSDVLRICVFSLFVSTAEYVAEILGDFDDAWLLTGRSTHADRAEAMDKFNESGGVLVTTSAAQGLNLATSHLAIHYDLPEGRPQMEQRWSRLDRIGQTKTVHAFALRDANRTLEWEEHLLQKHGFVT